MCNNGHAPKVTATIHKMPDGKVVVFRTNCVKCKLQLDKKVEVLNGN